jgi:hypothetical protein
MATKVKSHARLEEVKARFKEAAQVCKQKAAPYPKGERGRVYRACMSEMLRRK